MLEVLQPDESKAEPVPNEAWFHGRVRMHPRTTSEGEADVRAVFFDAGSHTVPHTHECDQVLHFVTGTGFVVFPGEERQVMPAGTLTVVPAGTLHMHGAIEDGPVCQISILTSTVSDWDPAVPDDWQQYKKQ